MSTTPTRREIILVNKSEESETSKKSPWKTIESVSKTLSIAAIPVVLAVGGWIIQQRLQDQTVSKDYVQLAVSILKEPESSPIKPDRTAMRAWAVKLLNDNSPTKFTPEVSEQLRTGQAQLPASFEVSTETTPTLITKSASNPRDEAASWESKGFDFLVSKNAEAALLAFKNAENLWPSYHNVAEIRKLLEANLASLTSAPKEGKSEAWTAFYRTLVTKYSWGMPADIKGKLNEQL